MGTCYIASTGELFDSTDEPYFQSAVISPSSSLYPSDDLASIRKVTHLINTGEWELCHMPSVIHFHYHQESSLALANQTLFTLARPHRVSCFCFCFRAVLSNSSPLSDRAWLRHKPRRRLRLPVRSNDSSSRNSPSKRKSRSSKHSKKLTVLRRTRNSRSKMPLLLSDRKTGSKRHQQDERRS